MRGLLTKIRGTLGNSLTWAALWSVGYALVALPFLLYTVGWGVWGPFLRALPHLAVYGASYGFIAGATFSVVLATCYRGERLEALSLPPFVIWAASIGILLARQDIFMLIAFAGLSVMTAVGTIRIAQGRLGSIETTDPDLVTS